ncbi:hypothetical protein DESC_140039 [Desulfosarcina cetonica]|nr:hypothetical protein DESC_140039 [Desulfosarcina cetonica]
MAETMIKARIINFYGSSLFRMGSQLNDLPHK